MLTAAINADGVVDVLDDLAGQHGTPHYVRFDNGPEFIAHAVNDWCRFNGTGSLFIDPGSPWQNAWIESFNGRLRDELNRPGMSGESGVARVPRSRGFWNFMPRGCGCARTLPASAIRAGCDGRGAGIGDN